ncbi:hypothetical protein X742_23210 [Mesorhizobium sp. LNHC232B00]|nr:hypothetical protein X742_23210 [Mesorhizobium sp. LNHC232B00]
MSFDPNAKLAAPYSSLTPQLMNERRQMQEQTPQSLASVASIAIVRNVVVDARE